MDRKTWTTIDKSAWGPGPWQDEPDKEQWPDPKTGLACLIVRSQLTGALCGYVGIPAGHPWHGADPSEIDADAHQGLNYGELCQEGPEAETICHVPGPGEPEPLYWVGFDCGHAFDVSPAMDARLRRSGAADLVDRLHAGGEHLPTASYKTIEYVRAMCTVLAAQAAEAAA